MEGTSDEQKQFWVGCWQAGKTGWHLQDPHPSLVENISTIVPIGEGSDAGRKTVFVPLCGKTVDLRWLRDKGYQAIGCELSELAVEEFFSELGERPQEAKSPEGIDIFQIPGITIYRCDIFNIEELEDISAVFDRASLVALPTPIRERYVEHVKRITHNAPQIVVTFEHERNTAPPHSIPVELVQQYYSDIYNVKFVGHRYIGMEMDEVTYALTVK